MAAEKAKAQSFTHVRVSRENKERAKEVSRRMAAKESRDVYYTYLIDEILEEGLTKRERKLGIA